MVYKKSVVRSNRHLVDDPTNPVNVFEESVLGKAPLKFVKTGKVSLQIGSTFGEKAKTARTATLTTEEARRVAIALLTVAEKAEKSK